MFCLSVIHLFLLLSHFYLFFYTSIQTSRVSCINFQAQRCSRTHSSWLHSVVLCFVYIPEAISILLCNLLMTTSYGFCLRDSFTSWDTKVDNKHFHFKKHQIHFTIKISPTYLLDTEHSKEQTEIRLYLTLERDSNVCIVNIVESIHYPVSPAFLIRTKSTF